MLVIPDKLVFIHMPKTGGMWCEAMLKTLFVQEGDTRAEWDERKKTTGWHRTVDALPDEHRGLPKFGFLRDPWSWYVSWFQFHLAAMSHSPWIRVLADGDNFELATRRLLTLGDHTADAIDMRAKMFLDVGLTPPDPEEPRPFTGSELGPHGITEEDLKSIVGSGEGFYTWQVRRLLTDHPDVRVYQMKDLRENLIQAVEDTGQTLTDAQKERLRTQPQINETGQRIEAPTYTQVFDALPELRDLVYERDRYVIDKFGYEYPGAGAKECPPSQKPATSQLLNYA